MSNLNSNLDNIKKGIEKLQTEVSGGARIERGSLVMVLNLMKDLVREMGDHYKRQGKYADHLHLRSIRRSKIL